LQALEPRLLLSADGLSAAAPDSSPGPESPDAILIEEPTQSVLPDDPTYDPADQIEDLLAVGEPLQAASSDPQAEAGADESAGSTGTAHAAFHPAPLDERSDEPGPVTAAAPADSTSAMLVETLHAPNAPPLGMLLLASPGGNATLAPEDVQALLDGMDGLIDWAGSLEAYGLVAQVMPFIGLSIGEALELRTVIDERLATPVINYLSTPGSKDSDGLVAFLQGLDTTSGGLTITVNDATVEGGLVGGTEFQFDLVFVAERTLQGLPINISSESLGTSGGGAAAVDLTVRLELDLTFGVLTSGSLASNEAFFIRANAIDLKADIHENDLGSTINVGFLGADLLSGAVNLDADLSVDLANPDDDPDGNISLGELLGTSFENLAAVNLVFSNLAGSLAIQAVLGSFNTGGTTLITLQGDPLDPAGPAIQLSGPQAGEILNFTQIGAAGMSAILEQVGNWLGLLSASDALSATIPYSDGATLGGLVNFEEAFDTLVTSQFSSEPGVYAFSNAQELADLLATLLGLDPMVVNANYDPATDRLSYHIELDHAFDPVALPVNLGANLGPINGLASASEITLTPSGSLALTVQVQLANTSVALTGNKILPANGVLSGSASFQLSINGAPPVALVVPPSPGNTNRSQLIGDINDAFELAGLTHVTASLSSNRLRLTTTGPLAGTSIMVITPFMDPSVSELGLSDQPQVSADTALAILNLPHNGRLTDNAVFQVSVNNGPLVPVTLLQSTTSSNANRSQLVAQVQDALVQAGVSGVTALLDNNRLKLVTSGPQAGAPLRVVADPQGVAATQLGFAEHLLITTQTSYDLVFLENLSFAGSIDLDIADLDATARFGIVGIGLQNGTASGAATFTVSPTGSAPKRLTDLFDALNNAPANFTTTTGGTFNATLPVSVNAGLIPLGLAPHIALSQSNPFSPATLNLNYADLGTLPNYASLDLARVKKAFADTGVFVGKLLGAGSLDFNRRLPILNRTLADFAGLDDAFAASLDAVAAAAPATLQELDQLLTEATFQVVGQDLRIILDFDRSDAGSDAPLDLDLATFAAAAGGVPNLAGVANLVGAAGLDWDVSASFELVLGFDFAQVNNPRAYLHDSTSLAGLVRVRGTGLGFGAATGALGVKVQNGTATLGIGSNPATLLPAVATIDVNDNPGAGGKYFNIASLSTSIAGGSTVGEAHATLPIHYPTPSAFFGTVDLDIGNIDTIGATTALTAPNFAAEIAAIDLLSDMGSLVDGLDQFFARLDDAVKSQVLGLNLPVVGTGLKDAFGFIEELRVNVVSALDTAFNGGAGPKGVAEVENALTNLFLGLGLISPGTQVVGVPGPNPAAPDQIEFNVVLSRGLTASQPIGFDIGLPGLGLSIDPNAAITVMLGYTLDLTFGVSRNEGVYFDTSALDELSIDLDVTLPGLGVTGRLGFLEINITDNTSDPSLFSGSFNVDLLDPVGTGKRLTLNELLSGSANPASIFDARLVAMADVNLLFVAGFGDATLPSLLVDFHLGWSFGGSSLSGSVPTVQYNNIRLNLGEFISGLVDPVLSTITGIFEPVEPFIEVLTAELPVISDLLGRKITMLDIAALFGDGVETAAVFIEAVADILAFADTLDTVGNDVFLHLGSLDFGGLDLRQPRSTPLQFSDLNPGNISVNPDTMGDVENQASTFYSASTSIEGGGFSFPLLEDPTIGMRLLFNQDVDLFLYDMPRLDFTFQYTQFIPVYAFIGVRFGGSVNVTADFAFGYDTYGLRKFADSGNGLDLLEGFFVSDWVNGKDVPEITVTGKLLAGAGADIGVASVFVDGGVFTSLLFNLHDVEQDGKFRGAEILDRLGNGVFCLFEITGEIGAFLQIEIEIGICPFCLSFSQELARVTMISFEILCEPPPVLADLAPDGTLTLNAGPRAPLRLNVNTTDGDESFVITRVNDDIVLVEAFGFSQAWGAVPRFDDPNGPPGPPITKIVADMGNGKDSIDIDIDLTDPVEIMGGPGNDVILGGGANDILQGGPGIDYLYGRDGADVLYGHSVSGSGDDNAGDKLVGGNGNDTLHGNGGPDHLFGENGEDTLFGGAGTDVLQGGNENDNLHGGPDTDALWGDQGVDMLYGDDGDDELHGGTENDTLQGGPGADTLAGEAGTDSLWGHSTSGSGDDNAGDTLYGGFIPGYNDLIPPVGDLTDTLHGQGGPDVLHGNDGDDFLFGEAGNDTIFGNDGVDFVFGGTGNDTIHGNDDADVLHGEEGDDTMFGGAGVDYLYGEDGNDKLNGDAGDDFLFGEANDDTLKGGTGTDTLVGGPGADTIRGQEGDDQIFGQDNEDILFGDDGDDLILGHDHDDFLHGGRGNDRLEAGRGNDILLGSDDDDYLFGEEGHDDLFGNDGNDHLDGGDGVDDLFGGNDDDFLFAGAGLGGLLDGGAGNDRITGSDEGGEDPNFNDATYFGDRILGGAGDDVLFGLGGADLIQGGAGNDRIDGGANGDRILGQDGHDQLFGGYGNDQIEGNAGEDFLDGGADTDQLLGGDDDDELLGGGGPNDLLDGGNGDDILRGSDDGPDTILGGAGRDRIFGNGGNDIISGGSGDDIIDGGLGDDLIEGGAGSDLITGGGHHDTIYGHSVSGAGDDNAVDYIYGDYGTNGNEFTAGRDQLFGQGGNDFLYGEGDDDLIQGGAGASNLVDYGAGESGTPSDFVPPTPTPNPALATILNQDAEATLPFGPDYFGRWTEFGGSASRFGVDGRDGVALDPSLATGPGGTYLAWADSRNGNFEIYVLMQAAGAWHMLAGSAHNGGVSNSLRSSRRPSIALDASGNPVVAWTEFSASGSDILVAAFDPAANEGQGGWVAVGSSLNAGGISGTGNADNAMIVNTASGLAVAWEDDSSGSAQVYVRRFSGGNWIEVGAGSASGGGVTNVAGGIRDLAFATDGTKLAVAWSHPVTGIDQVFLLESSGSTWNPLAGSGSGTGLSNTAQDATSPAVAYHAGSLFVAWQQNRPPNVQPTAIYAARFNGTSWGDAGPASRSGVGVSNSQGAALDPQLASNGGRLHLVWKDETVRINQIALFARVWDGAGFDEELPGDASAQGVSETGGQMRELALAVNAAGHPFVAWEETAASAHVFLRGNTFDIGTVHTVTINSSVQTVLSQNNLEPGDVIYVQTGSFAGGFSVLGGDSGVLILGSPFRNTTIQGAVTIDAASNIILQRLTLSGGVTLDNSTDVALVNNDLRGTGLTVNGGAGVHVLHNSFASNITTGLRVSSAAAGHIAHNHIRAAGTGLDLHAAFTGWVFDNDIGFASTGIDYGAPATLRDNAIHHHTTGVQIGTLSESDGLGYVGGAWSNDIFSNGIGATLSPGARMRAQHLFGNGTGVTGSGILGGDDFDTANLIESNGTGVSFNGVIQFNRIAGNSTGIAAQTGQRILHNLIYRNTSYGVLVSGQSEVAILNNTFYAPSGDNIRVTAASSAVEVRGNILWAEQGYNLYVANDSQTGFFSDYNNLHVSGAGRIGYWTKDFTDILDWQADIAGFDLHSIGRTVVNPTWSEPAFLNRIGNDYRIFELTAGQRFSSPTLEAGDPRSDLGVDPSYQNLLLNPGFENGTTGWTTHPGGVTSGTNPVPFAGSAYFDSGTVQDGFAEQVIDLLAAGFTAGLLDAQDLEVVFGGRIRSLAETALDRGQIRLTFLDGADAEIDEVLVAADNSAQQWVLTGDRLQIPVGTRKLVFRFESLRVSGSDSDSYLDNAFLHVLSELEMPNQGGYGFSDFETQANLPHLALRYPDLYVDWEKEKPLTIRWDSFGNAADSPVRIELYQDDPVHGPALLAVIAASTPDDGEHIWIPSTSGVDFGTYGLRIRVSLVNNTSVHDRGTEPFTVPEDGVNYYVDDASNANDEYTPTALGSNRHTGKLATAPKPNPVNLLRTYTLSGGATLRIDTGAYPLIVALRISGSQDLGLGLDEGFTMTGPTNTARVVSLFPAIPGNRFPAIIEVNDADFLTLQHLTFHQGIRGLSVVGATENFNASHLTAFDHVDYGIYIDADNPAADYHHFIARDNQFTGVWIQGSLAAFRDSLAYDNGSSGIHLRDQVGGVVEANVAYNNGFYGIQVQNSSMVHTLVGSTNLAAGRGNLVYDNVNAGIDISGYAHVHGNTVFGPGNYGIRPSSGDVSLNVIHGVGTGIEGGAGNAVITNNRIYNTTIGIRSSSNTITGNVVYSNATAGILATATSGATLIANNLLYANGADALVVSFGASGQILSNTIYQPTGNLIRTNGTVSFQLRNNILWAGQGTALQITPASQPGIDSDYNLFFTGANGAVGHWQNVTRPTLTEWRNASLQDDNSLLANPLFVDVDGADGFLGYQDLAHDGRDDDFHLQTLFGSFHGGALAPVRDAGSSLPVLLSPVVANDAAQSPAIDRGEPGSPFANETANNGGHANLGAYGNTAQASRSPAQYILIVRPDGGERAIINSTFTIRWHSNGFAGNVLIEYSATGLGGPFTTLAANEANDGAYDWLVDAGTFTAGTEYAVRVSSIDTPAVTDTSSAVFEVADPITAYYVDDASDAGDEYTPGAVGNDANDGLSPLTPKATIRAIVETYDLEPGNVIFVDTGAYAVTANIVLAAQDSGVTIQGPVQPGHEAVLNRGNTNIFLQEYIFEFTGADDITLTGLTFTMARVALYAGTSADSDRLTVAGNRLINNYDATNFQPTSDDTVIAGNEVSGNTDYGIQANGQNLLIQNNEVFGNDDGIFAGNGSTGLISDNHVFNNLTNGVRSTGLAIIENNVVHGQNGPNDNGINGGSLIRDNVVYGNTRGINGGTLVTGNRVYGNDTGLYSPSRAVGNVVYSNRVGAFNVSQQFSNNLLFDHAEFGYLLQGGSNRVIDNNTFYEPVATAVRVENFASNFRMVNNIIHVAAGYAVSVHGNSRSGFQSDYNLFQVQGGAKLMLWGSTDVLTQPDLFFFLGLDPHSLVADPLFVLPLGGDGMLGYDNVMGLDHALDNNFHLQAGSPGVDGGDPFTYSLAEAAPNGGRVNLGAYGNTALATPTAPESVQVVTPNGGEKLEEGQSVSIEWRGTGLGLGDTVALINTGNVSISFDFGSEGIWLYNNYQTRTGTTGTISTSTINLAGVANAAPNDVYRSYVQASSGVGNGLTYELPVPDGDYIVRLHFAEPSFTSGGTRRFDILINQQLLVSEFDIAAVAPGRFRAVALDLAATASGGAGLRIDLNNVASVAILSGIELVRSNPGGVNSPTFDIDVSSDNGGNWQSVATNRTVTRFGTGSYDWIAGPQTNGLSGLVRVTANDGSNPVDTSDRPFVIGPAGNLFYVNDVSTAGDEYATAPGDNANTGKSPDQPVASLAAIVLSYDLEPGDIVLVDTGTYNLLRQLVIENGDAGATFRGPIDPAREALIDGGGALAYIFELHAAHGVTLDHLTLAGGQNGMGWNSSLHTSNSLTVTNSLLRNNGYGVGFLIGGGNAVITGNTFHNNTTAAISIAGVQALVADNVVHHNGSGISVGHGDVLDNIVYSNSGNGIGGGSLVEGNVVYSNGGTGINGAGIVRNNTVFDNNLGISAASNRIEGNRVYGNATFGIQSTSLVFILNNVVYSNNVGISMISSSASTGLEMSGNLVYGNTQEGMRLGGRLDVFNNTVFQLQGDAIQIAGNNTRLYNNILAAAAGYVLDADFAPDGFSSNYNLFFPTGTAALARWDTTDFLTLSEWQFELGLDLQSLFADPIFVEPAGIDGLLGYDTVGDVDHGQDDDFHLQPGSPAIDRGDPLSWFIAEPGPNGGRANLGVHGNTNEATPSPAVVVQVLSPNGLERLSEGQSVPLSWHAYGLGEFLTVGLMNNGGSILSSLAEGDWLAERYRTDGSTSSGTFNQPVDRSLLSRPAPEALYQQFSQAASTSVGGVLGYQLPLADGSYVLRLHFAEPNVSIVGGRTFDIQLQGFLVADNYDIYAAAGNRYRAVTADFNVSVSGGNGLLVELVNQTNRAILSGIEVLQLNPAGAANPTVSLAYSPDHGASWNAVASGLSFNRSGRGEFLWTAGPQSTGFSGLIRVTSDVVPNPQDLSDQAFLVTNGGHFYYVNDGSLVGDEYTTAVGDNFNSGKSPDQPMASIGALLQAYDLGPGDIVHVDTGTYVLLTDIRLTSQDSGVRIQGPLDLAHLATIDRNDPSTFETAAFRLVDADDVTLDHLDIIGGSYGIFSDLSDSGDRLTVSHSRIHNNNNGGIYISGLNSDAVAEHNSVFNSFSAASVGIRLGFNGTIRFNDVFGNATGISSGSGLVEGNTVHDNTSSGITGFGVAIIKDNVVFGQNGTGDIGLLLSHTSSGEVLATGNRIYDNYYGVLFSSGSSIVLEGNHIYRNLNAGVRTTANGTIRGNQIYSNPIGIQLLGSNASIQVFNNLIYANTNQGIYMQQGNGHRLLNNTLYQTVGDAIRIESSARNVTLANNILWTEVGQAINLASNSQTGFVSDYNLFFRGAGATGTIGTWGGVIRTTLADWQAASGQGAHSLEGNPLFLDINGPDNVLGDPNVPEGDGDDDNFGLLPGSPAIDSGNAYLLQSEVDLLDRPRRDDPDTPNTGVGWPNYVEQDSGGSLYSDVGVLPSSGGDPLETLPFTFSFYGTDYTQIRISRRSGFIQFGDLNSTGFTSDNDLEIFKSRIRIAPLWDNHQLGTSNFDGVYFDNAVPGQYTVRWSGTSAVSGGEVNFSVTLFDDGTFRFDYGAGNTGLTPLVGISAGTGVNFVLSNYDGQANLENANSILWAPVEGLTYYDRGALEFQGNSADITPPQVTTIPVLPISGGSVPNTFSSIQINVTEPLDTISARSQANYELLGAGLDGQFDTTDDVVIPIEPAYAFGTTTVTLQLPDGVLPPDDYRLTLSGTKAIYDTAGNPLDGDANATPGGDYVHFFTVTNAAPSVLGVELNDGQAQRSRVGRVAIQFSEDVSASLGLVDFTLENVTTAQIISPATMALAYDPATHTATLTFPVLPGGILPDGNYVLTALANGIEDAEGVPMAGSVTFEFFVLTGDTNGDRVTNDLDLFYVWQNLLKPAGQHDLNHDLTGDLQVTIDDVNVVRSNYLDQLPPPMMMVPLASAPDGTGAGAPDPEPLVATATPVRDLTSAIQSGCITGIDPDEWSFLKRRWRHGLRL